MEEQKTLTNSEVEFKMRADPQYLSVARVLVRAVVEIAGVENDNDLITLAVEEALDNVIQHSYGGPSDKPIILKLGRFECDSRDKPALEIVIRDFGKQVDPQNIKGRDLDVIGEGGYGTHIIRSVMDEIEFTAPEDGGTRLRMVKY